MLDTLLSKTVEIAIEKGIIQLKIRLLSMQHIQMQSINMYHQLKN